MIGGALRNTIILVLLLGISTQALTDESYQILALELCDRFNCECQSIVQKSIMKPHVNFRDEPTHHCYNTSIQLDLIGDWIQPLQLDCPAMTKTEVWVQEGKLRTRCAKWDALSIGFHYYLDARNFWGQVISPKKSCVAEYDDQVDLYLKYGGQVWSACSCGVCTSKNEMAAIVDEYAMMIRDQIDAVHYTQPTVVILANKIDWEENQDLIEFLERNGVNVIRTDAQRFKKQKNSEYIIIFGGTKTPEGIGEIVSQVMNSEEIFRGLNSQAFGNKFTKQEVWVAKQEVEVYAGYTKDSTAQVALESKQKILEKTRDLASQVIVIGECEKAEDCGTSYKGPLICENRYSDAYQYHYVPHCRRNRCVYTVDQKDSINCHPNQVCITGLGCVRNNTLSKQTTHVKPTFTAKLLRGSSTLLFKDQSTWNAIRVNNNYNRTVNCEYYGGEGWEAIKKTFVHNSSFTYNFTEKAPNRAGRIEYVYKIRCGPLDSDDDLDSVYEKNLTYAVQYINYPLLYGFHIEPETIEIDACDGSKFVKWRVVNHGENNVTCTISPFNLPSFDFSIIKGNFTEESKWLYRRVDYTNLTYEDKYLNQNFSVSNGTQIYYLIRDNPELLLHAGYNTTEFYTLNNTYTKPQERNGHILIHTNDCNIIEYPISATCTDDEGATALKKEIVKLEYIYPS